MFGTRFELGEPVYILKQSILTRKWYIKECVVKAFKIHNNIEQNNIGPYVSVQVQFDKFEHLNYLFEKKVKKISTSNHLYKENDMYNNIYFDKEKALKECEKRNLITV